MTHSYRGWNLFVVAGYNNSNDLQVTITPAVRLDPQTDHLSIEERGKVFSDLNKRRDESTHYVRVVAKETVLFFFKAIPWDDAKGEAIKYIDKHLGWFDLQKFNEGKYRRQ